MNFLNALHVVSAIVGLSGCGQAVPTAPVKTVVAIGDSETYGRGLDRDQAYPAQLGALLGSNWSVFNAGVSGDTSRGMLARFDADVLSHSPKFVFIMAGENDIYYGYDPSTNDDSYKLDAAGGLKANIVAMIDKARNSGATVFVSTILPHGTIEEVPARQQAMTDLRAWELSYLPTIGVRVLDFYAAVEDPSHPGYSVPSYTLDNIHPSALGAVELANVAVKVLQ